ncbi:glycosyltransferase [Oceanimonas smirnovii]|uniref:glycosyltransferase n=1 Tax=Oceanimonas smirnovii TaxID=264574 RepID=UPI0003A61F32|nr:glycosyltransferase [Oceanimonas smirnovii]
MAVNTQAPATRSITQTYLAQGNSAMRAGHYSQALALFEQALKQSPALAKVIEFNIQLAQQKLGKTTPAKLGKPSTKSVSSSPAQLYGINSESCTVDIVVPVYNAYEDVQRCLEAIERNTDGFKVNVYIVNDGSEAPTTKWLRAFCKNKPMFVLTENEKNKGYTPTVNVGLRQCKSDYIVTLNSDTIVTKGWLSGLVRCFKANPDLGVAGPLSNAASWQNVPILLDEHNQFAVNELPQGWSADDMALLVRNASKRYYPQVPFVNGFCFMIAKAAFDKVGLLDEATFPTGYGEENDYCIRVAQAGFKLAICDDTYVFHAKSKSFGHEKRKKLSKIGSNALKTKHGKDKVNKLAGKIRDMPIFNDIREQVQQTLTKSFNKPVKDLLLNRILFLLPVSGGGGGVHSIVQETMGMRRIGLLAKIAVPKKHRPKFIKRYEDIDVVEDLFVGFEPHELGELSKKFDVIVGTIYTSMKLVKEVVDANPEIQPAYYVQDYEPLFSEPGTPEWQEARDSYTLVPNAILFAKTDWICQKVYEEHGVHVRKVSPSIDHDVYKPDPLAKKRAGLEDKIVISAMIRPKTPRRGAERTMRVLKRVSDHFGDKVHIELFGCTEDDPLFQQLERGFKYNNNGELTRLDVAAVLKKSDFFIDISDYQAFGRTGLEAMACGATLLSTKFGGVYEYVIDKINSYLVDPFNESCVLKSIIDIVETSQYNTLRVNAISTAAEYSIHKACISELKVLHE